MVVSAMPGDTGYQNVLTVANAANLIDAVREYGKIISRSGFFGCKTDEQGQALVLMAFSEGLPIGKYQERFHVVGTRLTMKADFMRSEFRRLGGDYRWINRGEDGQLAVLWVSYKGNEFEVEYSIDDAKREGLVKAGGNWILRPGDMLRARVATKAIRIVCPEVLSGMMSDEEFEAVKDADPDRSSPAAATATVKASPAEGGGVVMPSGAPASELATGDQVAALTRLFTDLSIPAHRQLKAIQQYGAKDMGDLTSDSAITLIARLEEVLANQNKAAAAEVKPLEPAASVTAEPDPIIAELQKAMKEFAQLEGNAGKPLIVKEHMKKHSIDKFIDLSHDEAKHLFDCLRANDLAPFLGRNLVGRSKNE
jgi:hypothetical protein